MRFYDGWRGWAGHKSFWEPGTYWCVHIPGTGYNTIEKVFLPNKPSCKQANLSMSRHLVAPKCQ